MRFSLSEDEKKTLLRLARHTIEDFFDQASPFSPELTPLLKEAHPCFVTIDEKNGRLRGCMGCLQTQIPLYELVPQMSERAAFADSRFSPIEAQELGNLLFSISVLGPRRPLDKPNDIEIGRHGLEITHGKSRGVLLAKVAEEQNWTADIFLARTCEKAELDPLQWQKYDISVFEEISFGEPAQNN